MVRATATAGENLGKLPFPPATSRPTRKAVTSPSNPRSHPLLTAETRHRLHGRATCRRGGGCLARRLEISTRRACMHCWESNEDSYRFRRRQVAPHKGCDESQHSTVPHSFDCRDSSPPSLLGTRVLVSLASSLPSPLLESPGTSSTPPDPAMPVPGTSLKCNQRDQPSGSHQ